MFFITNYQKPLFAWVFFFKKLNTRTLNEENFRHFGNQLTERKPRQPLTNFSRVNSCFSAEKCTFVVRFLGLIIREHIK